MEVHKRRVSRGRLCSRYLPHLMSDSRQLGTSGNILASDFRPKAEKLETLFTVHIKAVSLRYITVVAWLPVWRQRKHLSLWDPSRKATCLQAYSEDLDDVYTGLVCSLTAIIVKP